MKPIALNLFVLDTIKNILNHTSQEIDNLSISKNKKIHLIRVMSKKMRSMLYLIKPILKNKDFFEDKKRFYKELSEIFLQDREQKVMYDTFQWIVKKSKLSLDDFENIQSSLQQNLKNKTISSSSSDKNIEICKQSILIELSNFDTLVIKNHPISKLYKGFQKTYQKAYNHLNIAIKTKDIEDIHMFRKYAKYHMYQIQLLSNHMIYPKKRAKNLDKLTSLLGKSHDLALFEDYLNNNIHLMNADLLLFCIAKEQKKLIKKVLKSGTKIFGYDSKKFKLF